MKHKTREPKPKDEWPEGRPKNRDGRRKRERQEIKRKLRRGQYDD